MICKTIFFLIMHFNFLVCNELLVNNRLNNKTKKFNIEAMILYAAHPTVYCHIRSLPKTQ